jgi:hypothetical protein
MPLSSTSRRPGLNTLAQCQSIGHAPLHIPPPTPGYDIFVDSAMQARGRSRTPPPSRLEPKKKVRDCTPKKMGDRKMYDCQSCGGTYPRWQWRYHNVNLYHYLECEEPERRVVDLMREQCGLLSWRSLHVMLHLGSGSITDTEHEDTVSWAGTL